MNQYHTDPGVGDLPREPRPASFLPPLAQHALVQASQTPISRANPLARVIAIDQATQYARRLHPELFHPEI